MRDYALLAPAPGPLADLLPKGRIFVPAWLLICFALGGCADLDRISKEGGLLGQIFSRPAPSQPPASRRAPAASPRAEIDPLPEVPMPYKPEDFENHAADGDFAWHWTATRISEGTEVKGLIENRGATAVRGVTFALSGPEGAVYAESPGLIRAGEMRPFYFQVQRSADARQARLLVVAVDPVPYKPGARPAPPRREAAASSSSKEDPFTDRVQDHFFTLRWRSSEKGGKVEVQGLVENRDGPPLKNVTLLIRAYDSAGETVGSARQRFLDLFEKREAKPFTVLVPVSKPPERVSVSVDSYQFFAPGGR